MADKEGCPMRKGIKIVAIYLLLIAVLLSIPLVRVLRDAYCTREAKRRQRETAEALGLKIEEEIDLGDGAKLMLVLIPPGKFKIGSRMAWKDEERPVHTVHIKKPFWMGKYEVTQEQWEAVMGSNPSHFTGANHPVDRVSWDDIQEFLRQLNERVPGGGFGYCPPGVGPARAGYVPGVVYGVGRGGIPWGGGRGRAFGGGRGRWWRRWYPHWGYTYGGAFPYAAPAPAEERTFLENEITYLEQQLAAVKSRLDEIAAEPAEE